MYNKKAQGICVALELSLWGTRVNNSGFYNVFLYIYSISLNSSCLIIPVHETKSYFKSRFLIFFHSLPKIFFK
ncbi:Uncharacterised protein [Chlamydia trachomatis]|nr:Uncharacterised protein [Chlamydia trachomatis]